MKIGTVELSREILVVAEIGNNHGGSVAKAGEMIRVAAGCGVGAVKLQTIVPERLVSVTEAIRLGQLRRLCLPLEAFRDLKGIADDAGVMFLSTPFDVESVAVLEPLVPAFKVSSGDNNYWALLQRVAATGKPVLLSTGLAVTEQILQATQVFRAGWQRLGVHSGVVLMHCVAAYPTPPDQANLKALEKLKSCSPVVGYSDHTIGTEAAVLATVLGARVIEKHFTLDQGDTGLRDHQLSADPKEMTHLIRRIETATRMLGDGDQCIQPDEIPTSREARRSIVARSDLQCGTVLSWEDLDWLRPAGGLTPGQEEQLIGRRLNCDVPRGTPLKPEHVAAPSTADLQASA